MRQALAIAATSQTAWMPMSATTIVATFGANRLSAAPAGLAAMNATRAMTNSAAGTAHAKAARRWPAQAPPSPGHRKFRLIARLGLGSLGASRVRDLGPVVVPSSVGI